MKNLLALLFLLCVLVGCTEQVDTSSRYVFHDFTIADYLQRHSQYSEFYRLTGDVRVSEVSQTTIRQLLTARGHYTVFAPTNEAIQAYLEKLCEQHVISSPSWSAFPDSIRRDSVKQLLVMSSIIDSGDGGEVIQTWDFPTAQNAEILRPNMYDRRLTVAHGGVDEIWVNGAKVDSINRDIPALNGVIHAVASVVLSNLNTLGDYVSDIVSEKKEGFYVSCLLLQAVGLRDSLSLSEDMAYRKCYLENRIKTELHDGLIPEHRYYGYTFFAETDAFWAQALGKPALDITVDDVFSWLDQHDFYPQAVRNRDYRSEDNLLNQFVTYHLLPVRLAPDRLVLHRNEYGYDPAMRNPTVAIAEYYTTMGKRRLMKLFESAESEGVYINRFPKLDNGRHGTYHETGCDADKTGLQVGTSEDAAVQGNLSNAMIYPLQKLLVYDQATGDNLGKERIRFDLVTTFPEAVNNGARVGWTRIFSFPKDSEYRYLSDAWLTDESNFFVNTGGTPEQRGFGTYCGDEMASRGITDLTLRLPPVPREGLYELRYGITAADNNRGIFQFYWGNDRFRLPAMGIPLDLRMGGLYYDTPTGQYPSRMGWEADTDDDDYNAEVDKFLRNHGFMKGVNITTGDGVTPARTNQSQIRRIILREWMKPDETYYIRLKSCLDYSTVYLVLDYFEYCPKEVYDNPETPEDIW